MNNGRVHNNGILISSGFFPLILRIIPDSCDVARLRDPTRSTLRPLLFTRTILPVLLYQLTIGVHRK